MIDTKYSTGNEFDQNNALFSCILLLQIKFKNIYCYFHVDTSFDEIESLWVVLKSVVLIM